MRVSFRIDVKVKNVYWSDSGDWVAIATADSFYILEFKQDVVDGVFNSGQEIEEDGIEEAFEVVQDVSEQVRSRIPSFWDKSRLGGFCDLGGRLFRVQQQCVAFELLRWWRSVDVVSFGSSDVFVGLHDVPESRLFDRQRFLHRFVYAFVIGD